MSTLNSFCTFTVLLFNSLLGADGYFLALPDECSFSKNDLSDMEFIRRGIFNKKEILKYNSTLNKFEGYTEFGVLNAKRLNQDEAGLQALHSNLDAYCRPNAERYLPAIFEQTLKPTIRIKSSVHGSHKHTSMLVCSAYDYYPRGIKVTWLKDGNVVESDVTSTEELANGNWFYQVHSYLEYTPRAGVMISCQVEHASLQKAEVVEWDPSMSEAKRNKVIIGASGLVLGLIITVAGVIYYKKKSTGRILVPSS